MNKPQTAFTLLCGTALLLATNANAQSTWAAPVSGLYTNDVRWLNGTAPGLGATANITQRGGPYTVSLNTAVTNAIVNIGGQTGTDNFADITLDLTGGGALTTTSQFRPNNASGTPSKVTFKNGTLNHSFANGNDLALALAGSNNTFVFTNVNFKALGTGAHRTSTFANANANNSHASNNRMEIRGNSKWFWDNPATGDGFYCVLAGNGGTATNNTFIASGPDVKLVFSAANIFNTMRGGNNGTGVIADNEVLIENGAQVVCSNRLFVAEGALARNNTFRVTGTNTWVWTQGTAGSSGASGGICIGWLGLAAGASNNMFRVDSGARVTVDRNTDGSRAITIGGANGTHSTLKIDSGARLELTPNSGDARVYVGNGSVSGYNAITVDNATFFATNGLVSIGASANHYNSFTLSNGALFSNVTATVTDTYLFSVGNDTSLSNTVTITDSVFYQGSNLKFGGSTVAASNQGQFLVGSNATATVAGQVWIGNGAGTCGNLIEVSKGGKFFNTHTTSGINIGRNTVAGTGYNILRVTGENSQASFNATVAVGCNNAATEGNRIELLDGGELIVNTRYLYIGYVAGSKKNVLHINDGILNANLNLFVSIAGTNRLEVSGAKSKIHIDQLALGLVPASNPAAASANGSGAELEFTIGRDGIAPIIMEKARAGIPTAKIKVNVSKYPGGTLPLIINNTAVAEGTQEFDPNNVDIPPDCELIYSPTSISIKCPHLKRTLFLVR